MEKEATPAKAIAMESLTEESIKDASVADCEGLLGYMHSISETLSRKKALVAAVMEKKQRAADIAAKAAKLSDAEKAEMLEHLSKPPAQHLQGDRITKDGPDVNPGG